MAAGNPPIGKADRTLIGEGYSRGADPEIKAALDRSRLQEQILSSTPMVGTTQACQLLGLSVSDPSAAMRRREHGRGILRFTIRGRAAFPLFQFDVEGQAVFPAISKIMALKPTRWSDFRLLQWLTCSHRDFGNSPSQALPKDGPAVVAAFIRDIEPPMHG